MFGELDERSLDNAGRTNSHTSSSSLCVKALTDQVPEPKPNSLNNTFENFVPVQTEMITGAKLKSEAQVAAPYANGIQGSPGPATSVQNKSADKFTPKVAIANVTRDKQPLEPWHALCDLYYKGTPGQPEHKKSFVDASAALSQFALRHMLSEKCDCSNTLLWTSEIQMEESLVSQTFTVYPVIDGPKRKEMHQNYDIHWAIITFTDERFNTKTADLHEVDKRLMMAIRNVVSMGYHVDVWNSLDEDAWHMDLMLAEAELARDSTMGRHISSSTRNPSVFLNPQHLERRKKYEALVQHGVAGFLQADLDFLDGSWNEHLRWVSDKAFVRIGVLRLDHVEPTQLPLRSVSQDSAQSELMGFLEYTEETIGQV